VLAADVRFEGFTTDDWRRVLSLFTPRRASGEPRDPSRPKGGVVAVHDGGALIKLVHTHVGRLRLDDLRAVFPVSAEEVAHRHHASWALVLERGALEAIMEGFGARARRGDDLTAQLLLLATLAREELSRGRVELWPGRLRGVPIPSPHMVARSLDAVCPRGRSMVVGLFEDGELFTCLVLRRGPAGFDLVLGPDELRADLGLLSGDWGRDYRHLERAVTDRAGPLAFGCYADAATLRRLAVDDEAGAWTRAVALREVILHPLPAPLAIPLGIDAGLAALAALRGVVDRLDPLGVVAPAVERFLDELTAPAEGERAGEDPAHHARGFHPLELLRKILARDH
jgi:hypothetical protein